MTDAARRKALKLACKLEPLPMGVFAIRNRIDRRVLIGPSRNLVGSLNRHRMELRHGVHRHAALMADWRRLGESAFDFEVVVRVVQRSEPGFDAAAEIESRLAACRLALAAGPDTAYA